MPLAERVIDRVYDIRTPCILHSWHTAHHPKLGGFFFEKNSQIPSRELYIHRAHHSLEGFISHTFVQPKVLVVYEIKHKASPA